MQQPTTRYTICFEISNTISQFLFQELQGLIDEANQSLEESGTPSHEIMVIVLHREFTAGSIGITLAGGADYENKEITVRKKYIFYVKSIYYIIITFF